MNAEVKQGRLGWYDNYKSKLPLWLPPFTVIVLVLLLALAVLPPFNFPVGTEIEIEEGKSFNEIAQSLKDQKVITSKWALRIAVTVLSSEEAVLSGDYYFETAADVLTIANRITKGAFGLDPNIITIHEGLTIAEMDVVLAKRFEDIEEGDFALAAGSEEGYYFPDTYFFLPNTTAESVATELRTTFDKKIEPYLEEIEASGYTLHEILTMASLIEEEAPRSDKHRRLISGVLWNRIEDNHPLQVDAVFPYINGLNTFTLTLEDLREDHPYNTYTRVGLPPGPITNPGLKAIEAALRPTDTDYYFYLTGLDGRMHYALDFETHKLNKASYLR